MGKTSIEWTNETWNPVTGCSKISAGCDNCFAENIASTQTHQNGHQSRPLHRTDDAKRRPPPLPPPVPPVPPVEFFINPQAGSAVVGLLPAPPGVLVRRLDRDKETIDELAVIGFVVMSHFHHTEKTEIYTRPVTARGVVGGRYELIEPVGAYN